VKLGLNFETVTFKQHQPDSIYLMNILESSVELTNSTVKQTPGNSEHAHEIPAQSAKGQVHTNNTQWVHDVTTSYALERSKQITGFVSDSLYCSGARNARRCEDGQLYKKLHFPHTFCNPKNINKRRAQPTPWAKINDLYFVGNDYLDLIVYDLFFKNLTEKGFYVEIGASDGISADNTLFFDDCLGWDGLLVETTACAICMVPFNRPSAIIEHVAIGKVEGIFDPRPMKMFCTSQHPHCLDVKKNLSKVPCMPAHAVLEKHSITHIDLLSIDIEHASEHALDTIDFDKVSVSVVLIECRKRVWCEQKFQSLGFKHVWLSKFDILAWNVK